MSSGEDFEINIRMNMNDATTQLVNYEMALRSILRLAKKMGLPDEVNAAITELQKLIRIVHSLRIAYQLLQSERLAAGDPLAWLSLATAVSNTVITATELG